MSSVVYTCGGTSDKVAVRPSGVSTYSTALIKKSNPLGIKSVGDTTVTMVLGSQILPAGSNQPRTGKDIVRAWAIWLFLRHNAASVIVPLVESSAVKVINLLRGTTESIAGEAFLFDKGLWPWAV